jgi:hypothetical protein
VADIRVRPVQGDDVARVAAVMRVPDQEEVALYGITPTVGLQLSVDASLEAWTVDVDGVPAAIFGLARGSGDTGAPWLLATDAFAAAGMGVARRARRIVRSWSRSLCLENKCDGRNVVAVRFLEWLGFTLHPQKGRIETPFSMPRGGCP